MTNSKYLGFLGGLLPLLFLGCSSSDSPKPNWPTAYSWGSYGWSSESGSEMRVSLTRLIEGDKRVLLTRMELKDKNGCQAYTMRRPEDEPLVTSAFNIDWLVVIPRESPEPCGQVKTSMLLFRDSGLRTGFSAESYISQKDLEANPQIPLALALGTRSLLVIPNEHDGAHYLPPLTAIWDLEQNKFVGIALQGSWSKDRTSEASFRAPATEKFYSQSLFERDETDKGWKKKRSLYYCMYVQPRERSADPGAFASENLIKTVEQIINGKGNCP